MGCCQAAGSIYSTLLSFFSSHSSSHSSISFSPSPPLTFRQDVTHIVSLDAQISSCHDHDLIPSIIPLFPTPHTIPGPPRKTADLTEIWLEAHKNRSRWINLSNTQSTLIFYLANTYELLCSDNIPPDAGLQVDNLTIAAALFGTAVTRAVPAGAVLDADLQWLGPLSVSAQASEPMTSQGSQRSLSATQVQSQHQRRGTGTGNRGVGAGAGQKTQRSGVGGAVESDDTRDNGEQDVIRDNGEPDIIPVSTHRREHRSLN